MLLVSSLGRVRVDSLFREKTRSYSLRAKNSVAAMRPVDGDRYARFRPCSTSEPAVVSGPEESPTPTNQKMMETQSLPESRPPTLRLGSSGGCLRNATRRRDFRAASWTQVDWHRGHPCKQLRPPHTVPGLRCGPRGLSALHPSNNERPGSREWVHQPS